MVELVRNVSTYHSPRCRRQGKSSLPWAWAANMTIEEVFEATVGKPGLAQPARCCLGFDAYVPAKNDRCKCGHRGSDHQNSDTSCAWVDGCEAFRPEAVHESGCSTGLGGCGRQEGTLRLSGEPMKLHCALALNCPTDCLDHGEPCAHANTMQSRNISRTLICLDCGKRDPFAAEVNNFPEGRCICGGPTLSKFCKAATHPPVEFAKQDGVPK